MSHVYLWQNKYMNPLPWPISENICIVEGGRRLDPLQAISSDKIEVTSSEVFNSVLLSQYSQDTYE